MQLYIFMSFSKLLNETFLKSKGCSTQMKREVSYTPAPNVNFHEKRFLRTSAKKN